MTHVNKPDFWHQLYEDGRARWDLGQEAPPFVRLVRSGQLPPGKMLVLGAGRGYDARLFARHGFTVTAVDFADEPVQAMQRLADSQAPVEIVQADFFTLPEEWNGRFNYILDYTSFCAILPARRGEYAELCARLLKPGGLLIMLAFPIGTRGGGPPYTVQPATIIELYNEQKFNLVYREAPDDSVPARRGVEELLLLQKEGGDTERFTAVSFQSRSSESPPLIRTPEERFADLPDYPFEPHYMEIGGARVHYVDEGAGPPILCLHGEPSWSYLYRKMIPILAEHGRVLAPDFIGFGKSDKYSRVSDYTFQMHTNTLKAFIQQLDLREITIVVQDWGGMIGLRTVAEMPERFARLVIMNTMLPVGARKPSFAFRAWRAFANHSPILPIGLIMQIGTVSRLPKAVIRAYQAPFPGKQYKAGARAFPALVPISPEMPGVAAMKRTRAVLREWQKPALILFSDKDPILGGAQPFFRKLIPTAVTDTIQNAGHFLQEDKGEEIARRIAKFLA